MIDETLFLNITASGDYESIMKRVKRTVESQFVRNGVKNYNVVCDFRNNSIENLQKGIIFVEIYEPRVKRVKKLTVRLQEV